MSVDAVTGALIVMPVPRSTAVIAPPPDLVTDPPTGDTVKATLAADVTLLVSDGSARDRVGAVPPVIKDGLTTKEALARTGTGTTLSVPDAVASVPAAFETVRV